MSADEIESILQAAFSQCDAAGCALSDRQKQILLHTVGERLIQLGDTRRAENPLDRLSVEERRALLAFVQQQESQQIPWKVTLLNDWLQGQDSGSVQFIREKYGLQWLDRVQPTHLDRYADLEAGEVLRLKVGDRIEVTNGLWEWVQENGPCPREWFPCTVVGVTAAREPIETGCVIRFDSGAEYEIQGVYDWNRPNWRWLQSG